MRTFLSVVLCCGLLVGVCALRKQRVSVRGKLMCGNKAATGIEVKLMDEDWGPDPDDQLDKKNTDANGEFELSGETTETTPIDPVLKVYHNCDDYKPCKRKWRLWIPNKYINGPTMNMGTMNLETRMKDEDRSCF